MSPCPGMSIRGVSSLPHQRPAPRGSAARRAWLRGSASRRKVPTPRSPHATCGAGVGTRPRKFHDESQDRNHKSGVGTLLKTIVK